MAKSVYLDVFIGILLFAFAILLSFILRSTVTSKRNADITVHDVIRHMVSNGCEVISRIEERSSPDESETEIRSTLISLSLDSISEQNIRGIESISCSLASVTPMDIRVLGALPKLSKFSIDSGDLSDSHAEEISRCLKKLFLLMLRETTLTPSGWYHLGKMTNISQLDLVNTSIPDESFKEGVTIAPVELMISNVQISEVGLKKLIKTDNLEMILLLQTNITDDVTSFFNECPNLESIMIQGSNIKCRFITEMQRVDKLKSLTIVGTDLDNVALASIIRFKKLKKLSIQDCEVSEDSIPFLKTLTTRLGMIELWKDDVELFYHRDSQLLLDYEIVK